MNMRNVVAAASSHQHVPRWQPSYLGQVANIAIQVRSETECAGQQGLTRRAICALSNGHHAHVIPLGPLLVRPWCPSPPFCKQSRNETVRFESVAERAECRELKHAFQEGLYIVYK